MTPGRAGPIAIPVRPTLSVFIPTFGRAEYARALISRLAVEIMHAPKGTVEVIVSDNCSFDHTADVLRSAMARWPWVSVIRPPAHLISAEENVFFALQHCRGEYVWGIGDDDEVADGALARVLSLIGEENSFDLLFINAAAMNARGEVTRSRLVAMHAERVWWPVHRIVAAIGFMALAACLTAVVARRDTLLHADWPNHLGRSAVYAHVVAYLEAFRDHRCLLLDEALVIARQGATGLSEFTRLGEKGRRYVYWPWAVGLPRHLAWLVAQGVVPSDFPARILEPQFGRVIRLLPYLLRCVANQLEVWLQSGAEAAAFDLSDFEQLSIVFAGAPRVEREVARELISIGNVVASVNGVTGSLPARIAIEALSKADRDAVAAASLNHRRTLGAWLAGTSDGRDASSKSNGERVSLRGFLRTKSTNSTSALREALAPILTLSLRQLAERAPADALADVFDPPGDFRLLPLGGVYAAIAGNYLPTPAERDDLLSVNPMGRPPEICVHEDREAITVLAAEASAQLRIRPAFDETFLGWRLGSWRGRQFAQPEGEAVHGLGISDSGDRRTLRLRVLRARRELAPALHSPTIAEWQSRPVANHDRRLIEASGLFDPEWYVATYASAKQVVQLGVFSDPLAHWLSLGSWFGLDPCPWFKTDYYFAENPDVAEAVDLGRFPTALHHYLAEGADRLSPFPPFDPAYYLTTHPEAAAAWTRGITPLQHFVEIGLTADLSVSREFNSQSYLAANPDVARAVRDGLVPSALFHYVQHGLTEGRAM